MASFNNLTKWHANFAEKTHVQTGNHTRAEKGGFLSGESAVVVSGPPSWGETTDVKDLVPIGLVQATQINQRRQLNELYELGGRVPFFVPSRNQIVATLSRILFDGPSLFYALYQRVDGDESTVPSPAEGTSQRNNPTRPFVSPATQGGNITTIPENVGNFWTNLGSSIFNRPLGLGFILYDMKGRPYGGTYLEKCYIESHSIGFSANATVLAENINLRATQLRPLSAESMPGHEDTGPTK